MGATPASAMTRSTLVAWMPSSAKSRVAAARIRSRGLVPAMRGAPLQPKVENGLSCRSVKEPGKLCKHAECISAHDTLATRGPRPGSRAGPGRSPDPRELDPMTTRTPTGRRRRLGAELRRLREDAGLTIDRVAEALECSQSKVSRIETGQVSATPRDVRDMLELYRVDEDRREAMVQIAREARQRGWWQKFVDVPDGVPAYVGLEAAATSIDVYMSLIVPALLQTPDYARAVIGAVRPDLPPAELDRRGGARPPPPGVPGPEQPPAPRGPPGDTPLARPVGGPAMMAAQRRRLVEDADPPAGPNPVPPMG